MQKVHNIIQYFFLLFIGVTLVLLSGCSKFLSIPLPANQIAGEAAFANDASVAATLNNVYGKLITQGMLAGATSISYNSGLYTDELSSVTQNNLNVVAFYTDAVTSANTGSYWSNMYNLIYSLNATIEGVQSDTSALLYPDQWLGEAYFLRGFLYFYLTNLYGDVPLITSTLYTVNNVSARSPAADVYTQIVADLKQAQSFLSDGYFNFNGQATTDRSRPNRAAATALLARVYLYTKDYADAEVQADSVIANTTYKLEALNNVFLSSSQEIIWGIDPSSMGVGNNVVIDATAYIIVGNITPAAAGVNVLLSANLLNAFEPGDQRRINWVDSSTVATAIYYYAYKYKQRTGTGISAEHLAALRLAEQYLIRAEARVYNNNPEGAQADLNAVRARAGLPATTASSQNDLLTAILHERQVELFTECGNRFFDLRRTGNLDNLMGMIGPQKGAHWQSYMEWWPILTADILANPNLTQTPGYQE